MQPAHSGQAFFRRAPFTFEQLQRTVLHGRSGRSKRLLHLAKSLLKLDIRRRKRRFRVNVQVSGKIDHGKQQITEFFLDPGAAASTLRILKFLKFLQYLGTHTLKVGPVKSHVRGP